MKKRLISLIACLSLALSVCAVQAEEQGEWQTVYEQNFRAEGLTNADVTNAGWELNTFRIPTGTDGDGAGAKDKNAGLQMASGVTSAYALYKKELSGNYKINFKMAIGTPNQYMIYFGGALGTSGTVDTTKTQLLKLAKASGGYTAEINGVKNDSPAIIPFSGGDYEFEITCSGNNITAVIKNGSGTTVETITTTVDGGADGYLMFAPGNGYVERMTIRNIKIEQYKRYITATVSGGNTRPSERPIDISFSETVTKSAVEDALSITPQVDYTVSLSEDGKTASVALDGASVGTNYTLTLNSFSVGNAFLKNPLTYNFSVYNTVEDVSDNFKTLCTVKNGSKVSAWIKLAAGADVRSVKLCAGNVSADAVYDSGTGKYTAEITPAESALLQFEITGNDDYVTVYKSKYKVNLAEISAQAESFADENGAAVTSLAGRENKSVSAGFATDADESLVLIALYDAAGNMVSLKAVSGKSAELENLPSDLTGCTVKAMLIKNFSQPAMLCGGMELK